MSKPKKATPTEGETIREEPKEEPKKDFFRELKFELSEDVRAYETIDGIVVVQRGKAGLLKHDSIDNPYFAFVLDMTGLDVKTLANKTRAMLSRSVAW